MRYFTKPLAPPAGIRATRVEALLADHERSDREIEAVRGRVAAAARTARASEHFA
jgi:hypothetical protein